MKIAAFVDEEGNALPFCATGIVEMYTLEEETWKCIKRISFSIRDDLNIAEIRSRIRVMAKELDDCKIFLAETINGTPYTILEGLGMTFWKIKGDPKNYFSYVFEEEEKLKAGKRMPKPQVIGDIRDGKYRINLADAMNNNPFTSKQILLPFLTETAFQRLEVICEHIPRWFEKEFYALKLNLRIENSADGMCHAVVSPQ